MKSTLRFSVRKPEPARRIVTQQSRDAGGKLTAALRSGGVRDLIGAYVWTFTTCTASFHCGTQTHEEESHVLTRSSSLLA